MSFNPLPPFKSDWETNAWGTQQQLRVSVTDKGGVKIQTVSQNIIQRIVNFFAGDDYWVDKNEESPIEIALTDVPKEDLQRAEKELLDGIFKSEKKKTVKDIIQEIKSTITEKKISPMVQAASKTRRVSIDLSSSQTIPSTSKSYSTTSSSESSAVTTLLVIDQASHNAVTETQADAAKSLIPAETVQSTPQVMTVVQTPLTVKPEVSKAPEKAPKKKPEAPRMSRLKAVGLGALVLGAGVTALWNRNAASSDIGSSLTSRHTFSLSQEGSGILPHLPDFGVQKSFESVTGWARHTFSLGSDEVEVPTHFIPPNSTDKKPLISESVSLEQSQEQIDPAIQTEIPRVVIPEKNDSPYDSAMEAFTNHLKNSKRPECREANAFLREAASNGHPEANYQLGLRNMWAAGKGLDNGALGFFKKAGEHAEAQFLAGMIMTHPEYREYTSGRNEEDIIKDGINYLIKAAEKGHPQALKELEKINSGEKSTLELNTSTKGDGFNRLGQKFLKGEYSGKFAELMKNKPSEKDVGSDPQFDYVAARHGPAGRKDRVLDMETMESAILARIKKDLPASNTEAYFVKIQQIKRANKQWQSIQNPHDIARLYAIDQLDKEAEDTKYAQYNNNWQAKKRAFQKELQSPDKGGAIGDLQSKLEGSRYARTGKIKDLLGDWDLDTFLRHDMAEDPKAKEIRRAFRVM